MNKLFKITIKADDFPDVPPTLEQDTINICIMAINEMRARVDKEQTLKLNSRFDVDTLKAIENLKEMKDNGNG